MRDRRQPDRPRTRHKRPREYSWNSREFLPQCVTYSLAATLSRVTRGGQAAEAVETQTPANLMILREFLAFLQMPELLGDACQRIPFARCSSRTKAMMPSS